MTKQDDKSPSMGKERLPPLPAYTSRFACLSLNATDRLRLLQFSQIEINAIRNAIQLVWAKGIQQERDYYGSFEFKLRGRPWWGQAEDAVPSRQLMISVLRTLYDLGWILVTSIDISKKEWDKDSLIFRLSSIPPPCEWLSISFNRGDLLRLIEAPEDLSRQFGQMIGGMLQKEGWKQPGAYEFKLRGYPWFANGAETVSTRMLILNMMSILESNGFILYGSIDHSTGTRSGDSHTSETDSWYCRRPIHWRPGMPVF